MATLLLTLSGPLQAWGSGSRFAMRQTEPAPTKSGVLGLVAAAKGIRRTEPLTELAGIRFGVRSDQPGQLVRDFQTARTLDGKESMPLSHRYYLGDAVFLAALESADSSLLEGVLEQLRRPVFPLYLGRRSCPPSGPIPAEIVDKTIEEAFKTTPWKATQTHRAALRNHDSVRVETRVDAAEGMLGAERLRDVPVSFDPEQRRHEWREVVVGQEWLANPDFRGEGDGPEGSKPDTGKSIAMSARAHDVFAAIPEEG